MIILVCLTLYLTLYTVSAIPVFSKSFLLNDTDSESFSDETNQRDYKDYSKQVFNEILNDPLFKTVVGSDKPVQSIDDYVVYLNKITNGTRTKLDEIKRREIERLNRLEKDLKRMTKEESKMSESQQKDFLKHVLEREKRHMNLNDHEKFDINDFKKLIGRIKDDISVTDKIKEREHKRHVVRKAIQQRRQINKITDPELRKKAEEEHRQSVKKRREVRKKIHEPGSENQMKNVWSKEDNLDVKDFDPKTFFHLHDMNQDNHWDINEVEAIVQSEINNIFMEKDTFIDLEEKYYEVMKMRQTLMEKMDQNKDQMIDLDEFIKYSNTTTFKRDESWKSFEEFDERSLTDEEYKRLEEEMENLIKQSRTNEHQKESN